MASHPLAIAWHKIDDMVRGGWYFGDEQSRNRVCHLHHNFSGNIMANLVGGNFYTGLMLYLGADDSFVGLMSMFVYAANALQMLSPLFLERFPHRKMLLIWSRFIIQTINIVFIGAIPFFPVSQQIRLILFGAAVLLINVLNALVGPGISVWHIQVIPPEIRVRYFAILNMGVGVVVAAFNLMGGYVMDRFEAAGLQIWGFTVLRILAFLMLIYNFYTLVRMKEYPYEKPTVKFNLKGLLITPFKEKLYLRTVLFSVLWSMVANMQGSYFTIYLLQNCDASYSLLSIGSAINVPTLLLFIPIWSKILSRFTWLKVASATIALYGLNWIALAFVTKGNVMWLYPAILVYAYIMITGVNLSLANLPYTNIPAANQTMFIGFYSAMSNMGALLGIWLGRKFILMTQEILVLGFCNKQLLSIIAGSLLLAVALIMALMRKKMEEPQLLQNR